MAFEVAFLCGRIAMDPVSGQRPTESAGGNVSVLRSSYERPPPSRRLLPPSDTDPMSSLRKALLTALLAAPVQAQVLAVRPPSLSDQWTVGFSFLGGIPL